MKTLVLTVSSAILLASIAVAHADSVTGDILAFDRKAGLIVLEDKTVWSLANYEGDIPEDLKAGDMVEINTEDGGEEGIGKVLSIVVVN